MQACSDLHTNDITAEIRFTSSLLSTIKIVTEIVISLLQIPIDLHDKEFLPILQEDPLPPLALVSFTEEEQVSTCHSAVSAYCHLLVYIFYN